MAWEVDLFYWLGWFLTILAILYAIFAFAERIFDFWFFKKESRRQIFKLLLEAYMKEKALREKELVGRSSFAEDGASKLSEEV